MNYLLFFIFMLLLCYITNNRETFVSEPQRQKMLKDINENKHHFKDGSYIQVKKNIGWIDPVVFNDVYELSRNKEINKHNLERYINF